MVWSKNQIIALIALIIMFIGLISNFIFDYLNYSKIKSQQQIIIHQIDKIEGKVGKFDKLITKEIFYNDSTRIWFSNGSWGCLGMGC